MIDMPYGNAVGALLYLATSTRPDISFTVATLCRFIANPGVKHWNAVKHLLRYLQGTKDVRLVYRRDLFDPRTIFTTYCNADHAGNTNNGRSTGSEVPGSTQGSERPTRTRPGETRDPARVTRGYRQP